MERRLLSDTLLRSRKSSLLLFLAPSVPPFWRPTTTSRQMRQLMLKPPSLRTSRIHTTACQRADNTADLDFLEDKPGQQPKQSFRSPPSQRPGDGVVQNQVQNLLNSTFPTPNPAKRNPTQPLAESSYDMIDTAFRNTRKHEPVKRYQGLAEKMLYPPAQVQDDAGRPANLSRDAYRALESTKNTVKRAKRTVRSRPTVGRTIEVEPHRGIDVGRALRNLDIACSVNRVKQDMFRQRFHERPGLKRKRLKSERWRKMFMQSFKATVMRVREMRRKGW